MYPDLPIGGNGARELRRGEVERRGEQARGRGDVERPCAERRVRPRCSEVMGAALRSASLVVRAELRCDLQQQRERAGDVRRRERRPARPVASKPKRSVERMPVPAATSEGTAPPSQRDGPMLENAAIVVASAAAPTAKASGRLAGDVSEEAPGPSLPAAKTGRMCAARKAWRSGSNSRSQVAAVRPTRR